MDIGASETETFWQEIPRKLEYRDLAGVKLVISNAHEGVMAAVSRVFRATWQRAGCTPHPKAIHRWARLQRRFPAAGCAAR
jgi:putative transposase